MNDITIYRPYKVHAWTLPFTVTVGVFAFVATGYCVPYWGYNVLILAVIGIVCAWLTKVFYDTSNLTVIFEQHGLRTIASRYDDCRYVLWEELLYAYYVRGYKGLLTFLNGLTSRYKFWAGRVSSNALSPKEAKRFANRGANSSRICIDSVFVIYIDIFQDASQLRELIENHVVHIDTY